MNTNKKQIDLSIPSMQSTHCQNRVSNEVSKIKGVEIQNLESGKLTVLLTDESLKENVTFVIEKQDIPFQILKMTVMQVVQPDVALIKPITKWIQTI